MFDRLTFFVSVRMSFGKLRQDQVDTANAMLAEWERRGGGDDRHLAYAFATSWDEAKLHPIPEGGGEAYWHRMYDMHGSRPKTALELGNTQPGDGVLFHGRGLVQLTGRSNYERAGKKLGVDLIAHPERALELPIAVAVLFDGMSEGWFTGRRLSQFFNASTDDAVGARRIINGQDKANLIAGHHRAFLAALRAAAKAAPAAPAPDPVSLPPVAQLPDVVPPAPKPEPAPKPAAAPASPARKWAEQNLPQFEVAGIQRRLIELGLKRLVGKVDGVWGERTTAAVAALQFRAGLEVDGHYGPHTKTALAAPAPQKESAMTFSFAPGKVAGILSAAAVVAGAFGQPALAAALNTVASPDVIQGVAGAIAGAGALGSVLAGFLPNHKQA